MAQYQITSRPRHLRYIYFIDDSYSYDKLYDLICKNQRMWGGRYNPIIPVVENVISARYLALLEFYDPDIVFYSSKIDPEKLKQLKLFNTSGYINMDETPMKEDIMGVDTGYFFSRYDPMSKVLISDLSSFENPLLSYYKLNFGLEKHQTIIENDLARLHSQIPITKDNFSSLNQILHTDKPIDKARLSRLNLNTSILRCSSTKYTDFEIVIAKDRTSTTDLLYFWNRLLFDCKDILYLTVEELAILSTDKFFGVVLYDLSNSEGIQVVSNTLDQNEIENLIASHLEPIAFHRDFRYKEIHDFPFTVRDSAGNMMSISESVNNQILPSENGLFHLPKLSFTNQIGFYPQKWAVDVELKKVSGSYQNQIKFPFTTETRFIIKEVKGRVNLSSGISIYIHSQQIRSDSLEVKIPEFAQLVHQLIMWPVIDGEKSNSKYTGIRLHDASNRLSAFFKLFNYDFLAIHDFFTDRFWVDIFEDLSNNNRVAGDSISFSEIVDKCVQVLKLNGVELGERKDTHHNLENLEIGLKYTIEELCQYRALLKGFKLKCPSCSSQFWYSVNEVDETVICKGCLEDFGLPVESRFAYKLNDLVKNNIFQGRDEKGRAQRDGNLAVIRTLVQLERRSLISFSFSPQLDLYENNAKKPTTDLDIVCIADGELIIGEAKHNSSAFSEDSNKSLKSLAEVAIAIRPDKIILSCYEDEKGRLEKAQKSLQHIFNKWEFEPEIETMLLYDPGYHYLDSSRYFYH